jgi:hypothetical protein
MGSMSRARATKFILLAVIIAGFYFFGDTLRPLQTSLQHEFDTWLSGEQEHLKSAVRFAADKAETEASSGAKTSASAVNLPTLEVRIRQPGNGTEEVYRVAPSSDPSRPQHLLRLLDLMKEAGVFDANRGSGITSESEAVLHFRVNGPDRNFESSLTASDVEGNIAALLLLKLFREFSKAEESALGASAALQASSASAPLVTAPSVSGSSVSSSDAQGENSGAETPMENSSEEQLPQMEAIPTP